MEKSYSESYAAAGVDITAGYRSVELMKQYVARTMNEHCIGGLGGFGGLFELDCTGYKHPVLISGTDGVGTKLKIAMIMDKHDTIGIDCVAMCVNDVICAGAKPLVFLDYIACGRNIPEKIAEIVKPADQGGIYPALEDQILQQVTHLILCKSSDHAGAHSKAAAQPAGHIILAAALPGTEGAGSLDPSLARVQAQHDLAQRNLVEFTFFLGS